MWMNCNTYLWAYVSINEATIHQNLTMNLNYKICGKSFKFQRGLWRHVQIHKEFSIKCDCGLSFSRRDSLKRHQESSSTCKIFATEHVLSSNASVNPLENH